MRIYKTACCRVKAPMYLLEIFQTAMIARKVAPSSKLLVYICIISPLHLKLQFSQWPMEALALEADIPPA